MIRDQDEHVRRKKGNAAHSRSGSERWNSFDSDNTNYRNAGIVDISCLLAVHCRAERVFCAADNIDGQPIYETTPT